MFLCPCRAAPVSSAPALSDEELARKAQGLFQEYLSTHDTKEAVQCVHDLANSDLAKVRACGFCAAGQQLALGAW